MPDNAVEKTPRPPNLPHSPEAFPSEPELATVPWLDGSVEPTLEWAARSHGALVEVKVPLLGPTH
jgi:hypothetical protein